MRRPTTILLLTLALATSFAGSLRAAEAGRLDIFMVFDTGSGNLARSVRIDEARLRRLWQGTIPAGQFRLTVLSSRQVKRAAILGHYARMRPTTSDRLLFYYAGHAATDPTTGKHYFNLAGDRPLFRREVVEAMEATRAPAVVLLTDCCSTPERIRNRILIEQRGLKPPMTVPGPTARQLHPTVRHLLFDARGTIDVTAATDNASWSDVLKGGLFTRSLDRLLRSDVKALDTNGDGVVAWAEFFPRLQDDTATLFKAWRKEMLSRGETSITERKQVPHAFSLGDGTAVPTRRLAALAVVNATGKPLSYRYRWDERGWSEARLEAGERKLHLVPLGERTALPQMEARFEGVSKPSQLVAAEWSGIGRPKFDECRQYRIRPRD